MAPKDRPGKLQLCAWFDIPQLMEIDKRVADLQSENLKAGNPLKVHRSDVLREIVDQWIKAKNEGLVK